MIYLGVWKEDISGVTDYSRSFKQNEDEPKIVWKPSKETKTKFRFSEGRFRA